MAAERSRRLAVVGPGELEMAILKPVLAGRRTVIDVYYDPLDQASQTAIVSLSVIQTKARI